MSPSERESAEDSLKESPPGNSKRLRGNHLSPYRATAEKSQPRQNALVMPTDSRGLLLNKCCLLLSTPIIPDHPPFWVNGCSLSHWQDKMTCAETGGRIMFQALSFTQCICVNDSNHLHTASSANNSPGSCHTVTSSPTLCMQR